MNHSSNKKDSYGVVVTIKPNQNFQNFSKKTISKQKKKITQYPWASSDY